MTYKSFNAWFSRKGDTNLHKQQPKAAGFFKYL